MHVPERDKDGANIVRLKQAPPGWTYELRCFEIETSTNYLFNEDCDGVDRGGITVKHYDAQGNEIIDPLNLGQSVSVIAEFEPEYNYEIIGGTAKVLDNPINPLRLWVLAVPDIPAPQGSKVMINGANFQFFDKNKQVEADGRVSKLMSYNATYHTNKLCFKLKYSVGERHKILIAIEHYKA